MSPRFWLVIALCMSFNSMASAGREVQELSNTFNAKLNDRIFVSLEKEFVIEEGSLVGVSSTKRRFIAPVLHENTFSFEIEIVKKQTNYYLSDLGEKLLPGETHVYPASIQKCFFTGRSSTSKGIYGICLDQKEGGWEMAGEVTLNQNLLRIQLHTATEYSDGYSASTVSGWKPIRQEYTFEFKLDQDMPELKTIEKCFNYDPVGKIAESMPYTTIETRYHTLPQF